MIAIIINYITSIIINYIIITIITVLPDLHIDLETMTKFNIYTVIICLPNLS